MRSYTSVNEPTGWLTDFSRLARGTLRNRKDIAAHVAKTIAAVRDAESTVLRLTGMELANKRMLEIGVGQLPRQMGVFAVKNTVTGIDLDVIPRGFDIPAYASMLRTNGVKRVVKTIARKAMGFDRAFCAELARQLGIPRLPPLDVQQMDATKLAYPDGTFDFIYSFDVFEHLPDLPPVLKDCTRVLKPGGVFHTSLHPITTEDGFHDLRIIAGERDSIPLWAHLRPAHKGSVTASSYLNGIRVADWRKLLSECLPGCHVELTTRPDEPSLRSELTKLRTAGELADYSDEELICGRLVVVWKKPG